MRGRPYTKANLLLRQAAHDLSAEGHKPTAIKALIGDASLPTIKRWLSMPRPTDEEVKAGSAVEVNPNVQFHARLPADLVDALHAEANLQNTSANRVFACAAQLYLDCMERARAKSSHPVDILGYR
jgi:hypothetical protein